MTTETDGHLRLQPSLSMGRVDAACSAMLMWVQGRMLCDGAAAHESRAMWPFSTAVKQRFWWSLGVPKCMVRVMSVVPQSYCAPLSSSSIEVESAVEQVPSAAR